MITAYKITGKIYAIEKSGRGTNFSFIYDETRPWAHGVELYYKGDRVCVIDLESQSIYFTTIAGKVTIPVEDSEYGELEAIKLGLVE